MPRHKLPADVIDLHGRHAHNRGRYEGRVEGAVQDDEPLGEPPKLRLMTFEEAWLAIVEMVPEGTLRRRDRGVVMEAARLYRGIQNAIFLADVEGCAYTAVTAAESAAFLKAMSKLGASPVDAAHVTLPKRKAGNAFDD